MISRIRFKISFQEGDSVKLLLNVCAVHWHKIINRRFLCKKLIHCWMIKADYMNKFMNLNCHCVIVHNKFNLLIWIVTFWYVSFNDIWKIMINKVTRKTNKYNLTLRIDWRNVSVFVVRLRKPFKWIILVFF